MTTSDRRPSVGRIRPRTTPRALRRLYFVGGGAPSDLGRRRRRGAAGAGYSVASGPNTIVSCTNCSPSQSSCLSNCRTNGVKRYLVERSIFRAAASADAVILVVARGRKCRPVDGNAQQAPGIADSDGDRSRRPALDAPSRERVVGQCQKVADEPSVGAEHRNASVPRVAHDDVSAPVATDAEWPVELQRRQRDAAAGGGGMGGAAGTRRVGTVEFADELTSHVEHLIRLA